MLHRDKQLQIDSHGVLEVSVDGTRLMSQMLREHQIYICVIDGEIAGTLSYSEYNTPPEGGHPYLFKTHDAYKVYVSVSQPKGLTIVGGVCGKLNSIQEEVCKVIENTSNTQIQRAMSFWRKYHHIMNGSMISMAS